MPEPTVTKPWYLSKSIIGALIVIVATVLGLLGQQSTADAVTAESAGVSEVITSVIALIGAVVAIYGRVKASAKLTK